MKSAQSQVACIRGVERMKYSTAYWYHAQTNLAVNKGMNELYDRLATLFLTISLTLCTEIVQGMKFSHLGFYMFYLLHNFSCEK